MHVYMPVSDKGLPCHDVASCGGGLTLFNIARRPEAVKYPN